MSGIFRYNNTSNSTPNRRSTLSPFCTSPGQLQDVTMDNSYSMGYRSPCVSMPYGGNTSPGQGRSVREFEEQMGNLRKENFNLKLRIYFLEEKIPGYGSSTSDGPESFLKQNVDLKVDIEVLRKELQDKQSLLCEAAKAMELMEEQQKATEEKSQEIIDELNQKILYLEMEDKQLEKSSSEHHTLEQLMGRTDLAGDIDVLQKVRELEGFVKQYEQKTEELTNQINKLENTIEQKNNSILEMNEILKQIKFQNAELQEQLDEKTQQTANIECPKLREELHEHKKQLADKICSLEEYETKLKDKTLAHEQACNAIRKLILNTKDLEAEIDKLKKSKSLQNVSQIKEGTTTLNSDSVASSNSSSYKDDLEISTMKVKFEKIIDKKDIEIEKLKLEVKKKTANLQNLVNKELWEKNREIERLTKLLGKKNASSLMPSSPVHDIGQLQQSFSDSDYTQAVERNKHLQKRVDTLIHQLANVSDKNSDEVIQQLKIEIHDAREEADKAHRWRKECADVCAVLTSRLEELAGFLDTLLKHKDVLGALAADRRRAMRKAIDKSLDLSRSLNNMSLSVSRISMSEHSFGYMNNISELMNESIENKENKTFNSHENDNGQIKLIENLKTEIKTLKKELDKRKVIDLTKKERRSLPLPLTFDNHSESETWSEPDRNVSLARIGLDESINNKPIKNIENENRNTSTESDSDLNQKTRSKSQDKTSQLELLVSQRDNHILKVQCDLVEADNRLKMESLRIVDLKRELDEYKKVNEMLEIEIANYKAQTNQFEKVLNEQDINKKQLDESKQLIAQLTDDRGALNVEVRVAEMKIENLKTDLEEMKCKHELKLNTIIEDGKQKLHDLQKELTEKFETKLKDQEYKQKEYLAKDWISRIFYEETKRELDDVQKRLNEAQFTIEFMRENEIEFNTKLVDNEKSMRNLKKTLDEATLQASRAVLERTKILNDKLHLENKNQELLTQLTSIEHERNELNSRLSELENSYALLNNKLVNNTNAQYKHNNNCINSKTQSNGSDISQSGYTSEDVPMGVQRGAGRQRFDNSSPDLGIESDAGRASSVEIASADSQHLRTIELSNSTKNILEEVNSDITKLTDGTQNNMINSNNTNPNNTGLIIAHDCVKVDQENSDLRKKLVRTKRALEDTWNKLRTANQRKEQIERDIRQQILKTQTVLKNVRTNMETELEQHKKE